jgi:hypothetical protein
MIATDGNLCAVRLARGAVLLDSRRARIVEVEEAVATTLDIMLFGRESPLPATDVEAQTMRRALRALRQELFDATTDRPTIEMERGATLLRRYAEPPQWRRPLSGKRSNEGAVLTLGLVRRDDAAVVGIAGPANIVTRVTSAFDERGSDAADIVVRAGESITLVTTEHEVLRPLELWTVEVGDRGGLTLVRLSPARALVKLLLASRVRPSEAALKTLAALAERIPHFGALLPRNLASLARAVTEYFRSAIP